MTDNDKAHADALLDRIELAVGQLPQREGANGALITEIIQAVNGLRSLLGVVESH
ncbi:MAG: hypothetical protein AB7F99_12725 [Vicinamibacterales bacterium]